jgi:hypothetical protein
MVILYIFLATWAVSAVLINIVKYFQCKHKYNQMWSGDGGHAPKDVDKWSYYRICIKCGDWYPIKESQRKLKY